MIERDVIIGLMQSGNMAHDQINTLLQSYGLTLQQFNVLRILRGRNGSAACLESITNDMIQRMSNTSRLVDRLMVKALVDRKVCEKNRRKVDIFITDKGLKLLAEIDPVLDARELEITSCLTSQEKEQLFQLLEKLKS
ncbi:MAG: MarR family transcriptional regulator [Bacteroidetes bacterium]|nr:MarR family transcriptional regulator [Bacteroidota bacterium]MDA0889126.1 MarR family transcriptional regulator [Bacteroidota bacterium]MDA1084926.1 MarR family transcriptional regulator [Bacteroidota bacterium]